MKDRINRKQITVGKSNHMDNLDKVFWADASPEEKLRTITYLRECFYGREATTGRLQRFYKIIKRT